MNNKVNNYKKRTPKLKQRVSQVVIVLTDALCIFVALFLSYTLHALYNGIQRDVAETLTLTLSVLPIYTLIVLGVFSYDKLYFNRYDFWQETKIIFKSLFLSFVLLIAYVNLVTQEKTYETTILVSYVFLLFLLPFSKHFVKLQLFKRGYWKLGVKVLSTKKDIDCKILNNPYLGYIASNRKKADIVLIDSSSYKVEEFKKIIELEIRKRQKVMFVPIVNNYQFKPSDIFELSTEGMNVILIENRLKSKYRLIMNKVYNLVLAIVSVPFFLPLIGTVAILIKRDSKGPVFFMQDRITQAGKHFKVYKFRTMFTQDIQEKVLADYLEKNPQEIENYKIYAKYENDPRITKIGHFLRKTSLDEVAQVINVFKGEMNFIGPRPYMVEEKQKMTQEEFDTIHTVKPGITGLWQVSGRNELTFQERVDLEKWYVLNWSIWEDFVIFNQTFGVLLKKTGAK